MDFPRRKLRVLMCFHVSVLVGRGCVINTSGLFIRCVMSEEYPQAEALEDDDLLPEIVKPKSKQHLIHDLHVSEIEIQTPRAPAPVFHDTAIENHIDDDLAQINVSLRNLNNTWKAVRCVEHVVALSREIRGTLSDRRKLANKQLGHSEGIGGKGPIWQIPD
jgi:hypothetical protein